MRETKTSSSEGRPSRLTKPPFVFPAAEFISSLVNHYGRTCFLFKSTFEKDALHLSRCSVLWHDSFVCVIWLVCSLCWVMSSTNAMCHTWMRCVTHECDVSHMNAMCHTWIKCDAKTLPYLESRCATWVIHMSDMTHSDMWITSFTCVDSYICAAWLIHMCDMTHSYV